MPSARLKVMPRMAEASCMLATIIPRLVALQSSSSLTPELLVPEDPRTPLGQLVVPSLEIPLLPPASEVRQQSEEEQVFRA